MVNDFKKEGQQVAVHENDLLAALDYLDNVDPNAHRENWYKHLSEALDQHLKPRAAAYIKNKHTEH